ncbi:uncharacterized protein LOC132722785 [Ruditapes philippinarum]|uniref:uncharacterized protein LOC132722785 n=1 Tax=Ruditapes philippinarum TaxID=129788 RepID=UPI00295A6A3A|nr:uncharacterized protein LOC132722785 [Ruditapes philippinarum]
MATDMKLIFLVVQGIVLVSSASYDPLKINQPSISLITELNGYIGLTSGDGGDVHVNPGSSGSVYLDGEDLLYIIQMIESQPPVWEGRYGPVSDITPYGYLGEYKAGQRVYEQLKAVDPEGMSITYMKVAGDFPPGVSLDQNTGNITGIIPDADATYTFTIRATDAHGKFADNKFKMVVHGYNRCSANPCKHEGLCTDMMDSFSCDCVRPYGGITCNLDCRSNPLGIQQGLKYVTDAQMTGYNMLTSSSASSGRLNAGIGFRGIDEQSYLQIDFGNTTDIYRVDTDYYSSSYYTQYFYLQYSIDGNNFYNYTDYTGTTQRLRGATSSSRYSQTLPSVLTARYVRMFPLQWNRSYRPYFHVEMYGCYSY